MQDHNHNGVNFLYIVWYYCDALLLTIFGLSLVNIHLVLSVIMLALSIIYTSAKLVDLFSRKIKEKIKEKINNLKDEKNNSDTV